MRNTVNIDVLDAQLTNADIADLDILEEAHLIYNVIDIDPAMDYAAAGDEVIGTVDAASADEAIAKVLHAIGVDVLKSYDADGYAAHILKYVEAVPA